MPQSHADSVAPPNTRKVSFGAAFQLLCWEGAFAMAYETWVGPIYLSGLAGEIGVSVRMVSFLTMIPWLGAIGQLVGAWSFERAPSVKRYTLNLASAARALWLLPMFLAAFWGVQGFRKGTPFPVKDWFTAVICIACMASLLATSSGSAWQSWVKGLVPGKFRGRFFGVRQRYVMGALVVANLLASLWVGWKPAGYFAGYAIIGMLGLVAAATSTFLLSRVPDISLPRRTSAAKERGVVGSFLEPLEDRRFRNLLLYAALFNGALQLGGPYFPYYFTKDLKIPMDLVAIWMVLTNVGCFVASAAWGRRIDRLGDPRSMLWVLGHLIALAPLWYLVPSAEWIRWIAPVEYLTNGIWWSGYVLAMTALLFEACPKEGSARYFSVFTAASGLSGALCSFLGGNLAHWLAPWGGFRALWVIATLARLAVLWGAFRLLQASPDARESAVVEPEPAVSSV